MISFCAYRFPIRLIPEWAGKNSPWRRERSLAGGGKGDRDTPGARATAWHDGRRELTCSLLRLRSLPLLPERQLANGLQGHFRLESSQKLLWIFCSGALFWDVSWPLSPPTGSLGKSNLIGHGQALLVHQLELPAPDLPHGALAPPSAAHRRPRRLRSSGRRPGVRPEHIHLSNAGSGARSRQLDRRSFRHVARGHGGEQPANGL